MKYRILYSFYYLISLLPLKVLYVLSDIIAFVIHRMLRYRRAVITQNLMIAFPEKQTKRGMPLQKNFIKILLMRWLKQLS